MKFIMRSGVHEILELNPRFWLQHGYFLKHGNGLVKRYLDLESSGSEDDVPLGEIWVDSFWFVKRIVRGDLSPLRLLSKGRSFPIFCPGILESLHLFPRILSRKVWNRLTHYAHLLRS